MSNATQHTVRELDHRLQNRVATCGYLKKWAEEEMRQLPIAFTTARKLMERYVNELKEEFQRSLDLREKLARGEITSENIKQLLRDTRSDGGPFPDHWVIS